MNKLNKVIIFLAIGIIFALCYGIYASTSMIISRDNEIANLQAANDNSIALHHSEIQNLEFTIVGSNQELESKYITDTSLDWYINSLENRLLEAELEYQSALSYIETAEIIMNKIDIQYLYGGRR